MNDSLAVAGKTQDASKSTNTRPVTKAATGYARPSPEELHEVIAVAAYFLAERRNFESGHELEDWLSAEAQVLAEA